jgi:hypothetical protein
MFMSIDFVLELSTTFTPAQLHGYFLGSFLT